MIANTIKNFFQKFTKMNYIPPQRPLGRWGRDPKLTWTKVDHENMYHCGGPLCGKPELYSKKVNDIIKNK